MECNFVESKENFPDLFVCSNAQEIESAEELNTIDLSKFKSIGITAGASTPSKITLEIINQINSNQTIFKSNLNSLDLIKV